MTSEVLLIVNLVTIVGGALAVIGFFKTRESQAIADVSQQKNLDAAQNQEIMLIKQEQAFLKGELDHLKANTKELKGEIIEKVDKVNSKVDDLKYLIIELLAKQHLDDKK
jgi:septal ring factor EnvC (AmiA/AmiB activator)